MKRNDIFTFTAPNGEEAIAVALESIFQGSCKSTLICYGLNRIFTYIEEAYRKDEKTGNWIKDYSYGDTLAYFAFLPDYDRMLEDYQHQIDMANDYADKTL